MLMHSQQENMIISLKKQGELGKKYGAEFLKTTIDKNFD